MSSFSLTPAVIRKAGPVVVGDPSERCRDKVLLGKLAEGGALRELWLDVSGEQVVGIFGKRGTGKSYTLGVLIEGLSAARDGNPLATHNTARGGLVFDIMDIFWASQIPLTESGSPEIRRQFAAMRKGGYSSQQLSVRIWLPAGFENAEIDPPGAKSLRINPSILSIDDWGALFGINIFAEPRGMLISDLIIHVSHNGYTDNGGNETRANQAYSLTDLLNCLEMATFVRSYDGSTVRAVRQRLQSYAQLPIFQGDPTALKELILPGTVSVLMLNRVPDELKQVIVSVLMNQVLRERSEASFAQKRLDLKPNVPDEERERLGLAVSQRIPRAWVLMDEAHVLAGTSEGSVARDALIKYAKEGRNFGLSLAVATQQPSALDTRLMSQVETMICHQLTTPKDANVATENMKSPAPEEIKVDGEQADVRGMLQRLGQGEAVFSCGNAPSLSRLCVLTVRPRVSAHGGYEA